MRRSPAAEFLLLALLSEVRSATPRQLLDFDEDGYPDQLLKKGVLVSAASQDGSTDDCVVMSVWYTVKTPDGAMKMYEAKDLSPMRKHLHPDEHPERSKLIWYLWLSGCCALAVASTLVFFQRCMDSRQNLEDEQPQQRRPSSFLAQQRNVTSPMDPLMSRQARRYLVSLVKRWLADPLYKGGARLACALVFFMWIGREFTHAFIRTKMWAEVVNAISALHETEDLDRVYHALMYRLLVEFIVNVPIFGLVDPLFSSYFKIKLRTYVSSIAFSAYFKEGGQAYYRIKLLETLNGIDNPDQRVTQDVQVICENIYLLVSAVLSAVWGVAAWSIVLYYVANWKLLTIYLCTSFVQTLISLKGFGASLIRAKQQQLLTEAHLRYGLTRVRDCAEEVAFAKGDDIEHDRIVWLFTNYIDATWRTAFVNVRYGVAIYVTDFFPDILMWLVLVPDIYNGKLEMGSALRIFSAMDQLDKIISFLVNWFDVVTELQANLNRLYELLEACRSANDAALLSPFIDSQQRAAVLERDSQKKTGGDKRHSPVEVQLSDLRSDRVSLTANAQERSEMTKTLSYHEPEANAALTLRSVCMSPPGTDGILMGGLSMTCLRGKAVLVMGPSGLGKTSLLRAISGLWSTGTGSVARPGGTSNECLRVLPNKSYMPIGTLLDLTYYPQQIEELGEQKSDLIAAATSVLDRAQLGHLAEAWGWESTRDWRPVLSTGEQQRIGLARLFLHLKTQPANRTFAILDEATGSIDQETEVILYTELRKELAHGGGLVGFMSIGHRPNLLQFHESTLVLGSVTEEQEEVLDLSNPLASGMWRTPDGKTVRWQQLPSRIPPGQHFSLVSPMESPRV